MPVLHKRMSWLRCVVENMGQHLDPAVVILHAVDGQGDHFDVTFAELAAQPGSPSQLCGAHRGVVSGVGEQDPPSRI